MNTCVHGTEHTGEVLLLGMTVEPYWKGGGDECRVKGEILMETDLEKVSKEVVEMVAKVLLYSVKQETS